MTKRLIHTCSLLLLGFLVVCQSSAATRPVEVSVNFDYPLLRQLMVRQLFNQEGERAELLHDPSGCNQIVLTNPAIAPRGAEFELTARVDARLGIDLLGSCKQLLAWQGGVGFLGQPLISPDSRSVRVKPSSTWLIGTNGNKIVSGALWDVARGSLNNFFANFTLELSPYIDSLGGLLPEVLPHQTTQQLQAMISSLKLHDLKVKPASLDATIGFMVDALAKTEQVETILTEEELQEWETRWQLMDALLVMAVKHYAAATSLQEVRNTLLDMLIDSRYRLRDALTATPERANVELRTWFLQSWKQLRPLVRNIALEQPGREHLLWLSLLTATDTLDALDQLGPGIGLDISADGLRRMARMLNAGQADQPLRYHEAVDPQLQQLLRQQVQPDAQRPSALRFNFSLFPLAYAASPAQRLNNWAPDISELDQYLPTVSALLMASVDRVLQQHSLEPEHKRLFKKMVLTTAWQESCWRQYVVINKRLEPLRSSSGDVGLMQVNERVWRGFYDIQKLRWDIAYNSDTGTEILLGYLNKYALKKGEQQHPGGLTNLARASYSAYNGGPSQLSRYRRSNVAAAHRKIDEAFWDKYRQVDAGHELRVALCLGGSTEKTVVKTAMRPISTQTALEDPGSRWIMAQRERHYTLQLGAFSSRNAAIQFITQQSLPAPTYSYPVRKENSTQYLVLHGAYAERAQAESRQRQLAHLKPWLRAFADLRAVATP